MCWFTPQAAEQPGWVVFCCFPGNTSQELDWKWRGWDLNLCPHWNAAVTGSGFPCRVPTMNFQLFFSVGPQGPSLWLKLQAPLRSPGSRDSCRLLCPQMLATTALCLPGQHPDLRPPDPRPRGTGHSLTHDWVSGMWPDQCSRSKAPHLAADFTCQSPPHQRDPHPATQVNRRPTLVSIITCFWVSWPWLHLSE